MSIATLPQLEENREIEEHIDECSYCDSEIKDLKTAHSGDWGDILCSKCFKDLFYECCSCKSVYNTDDTCMKQKGKSKYCEDCFYDMFKECNCCSKTDKIDNMVEAESRYDYNYYCKGCLSKTTSLLLEYESTPLSLRGCTFNKIKYNRCFGIELEIDDDELNTYKICREKTNFGCYDDLGVGMEFYSPIMKGDLAYKQIKTICKNVGNPVITSDAGYHMHIDTRDLSRKEKWKHIRKIYYLYASIENYLYKIVDYSRTHNIYCEKHTLDDRERILKCRSKDELNSLMRCYSNGKFSGLNIDDWDSRRTIELRYHHGTADFDEVINWVNLNLGIFEFARQKSIKAIKEVLTFKDKDTEKQKLKKIIYRLTKSRKLSNFYAEKFKE